MLPISDSPVAPVSGSKSTGRKSRIAAICVVLIAGVVLAGWALDSKNLPSLYIGGSAMKANTAVAFLWAAVSLFFLADPALKLWQSRLAGISAFVVLLIAALSLVEHIFACNLGFDQLLVTDTLAHSYPGRMSPITATNFVLVGLALLFSRRSAHRASPTAKWLTFVVSFLSLLAMVAFAYDFQPVYGLGNYAVALNTGIAFLVLSYGILVLRPSRASKASNHVAALGDGDKQSSGEPEPRWPVSLKLTLAFGVAAAALMMIGFAQRESARKLHEANYWVSHTNQVLVELESIRSQLDEAEDAVRGYVITEDSALLNTYATASKAALDYFASLRKLTVDNPVQQHRLQAFEPVVRDRLRGLEDVLAVRKSGGFVAARRAIVANGDLEQKHRLADVVLAMQSQERSLLRRRTETEEGEATKSAWVAAMGASLTILLIILGGISIYTDIRRQKQTEGALRQKVRELRESESRLLQLNAALDLSPACIRRIDGTIAVWCRGNERLYGWSSEEAVGRSAHTLLQTKFPKPLEEIEAELRQRGSWEGELLHRTKAGSEVWVASSWVLFAASAGEPPSVIEVNNNITDRKRADEVSRLLGLIIESSDDAIISKDMDGMVTSWNSAAQRLFGYSAAEMIGRSILTLFPPELFEEETAIRARLQRGERIDHFETVRATKTGSRIAVSLAVSPIYNTEGKIIGGSKILRDISQKKILEEAFRESEERSRLAAEAGELGLWSFDPASRNFHWDARCKIIFGLSPNASSPSFEETLRFVHSDDVEQVAGVFPISVDKEASFDIDFRILNLRGELCWVSLKGRPAVSANRKAIQIHGTMADLTVLKQTEESLKRMNGQLQQFAYAAAHDMQEPLRNVALSIQLAKSQLQEKIDPAADVLLTTAVGNAHRMESMVRDLLAYSRVLHNDEKIWPVINSAEVFELAVKNLANEIHTSQARITHDALPMVKMDRIHLLQLFQNLIGNALKYCGPEPPQIHISSVLKKNFWEFSVRDNGIGINPKFHQRVFGIFKRLRDKQVEGSGVGLALCKGIAEHYGGEIWIESVGDGNGATFFFTVPAAS